MSTPNLELKGSSFTLSVLHINSKELAKIELELDHKLSQAPQFFLGAPLVLNLSAINDTLDLDFNGLKALLTAKKLVIVGVTDTSKRFIEQAKSAGLAILKPGKQTQTPSLISKKTKFIKQNIRSGQQIYAENSDLIIVGAVGNGAEVIADGSIHVYGALRGKAMAGAAGDVNTVVIASSMEAELVSIAGHYWLTENLQQHCAFESAYIRLNDELSILEAQPL